MRMKIPPTTHIGTIMHKTSLNFGEREVLVLPVHSRETRHVSRDGGNFWAVLYIDDSVDEHEEALIFDRFTHKCSPIKISR